MPYKLSWLVEGRVILNKSWGRHNQEDIPAYDQEMLRYLDAGTAPLVHSITDISELESMPSLASLTQFTFTKHPRLGWQVNYGGKAALKVIANIAAQLFPLRYRSFSTLEEALAFLQHVDTTLPVELMKNA